MYQVFKGEKVVAYVERPNFIRLHENGSYVLTSEVEAQGIALNGNPYQLLGRETLEGAMETVGISEVDGGMVVINQQDGINALIQTVLEG